MSDGADVVRRIVEGWPDMSVDDWREVCTDDVRYQNMPWTKTVTVGPDEIHRVLEEFGGPFEVDLEAHHVSVDGDIAFSERTEHFVPRPGVERQAFVVPVTGVFELRDGKVSAWRDYFDRRAMKA